MSCVRSHCSSVGQNMTLFKGMNVYIPVIIGGFALLTLLNVFERTLRLFGVDQRGAPRKGNVEDEDKISDGKSLIARGMWQPPGCLVVWLSG